MGAAGTVLQRSQLPRAVAPTPAVEGLGADVEVATGEASIVPVVLVVVHPLEATPGFS